MQVASDPRAVIPERALVLELTSAVGLFQQAAQALGLEWLGSMVSDPDALDEEEEADVPADADAPPVSKVFYLTMPSEQGLQTLLRAWRRFKAGELAASPDQNQLWNIFEHLADLRTWSTKDRIDPSLAQYVEAILSARPDDLVSLEVDLWYRNDGQRRDQALAKLYGLAQAAGGGFDDTVEIPEIQYQGVLVRIPGVVARQLIMGEGGLARLDDIMRIRPQAAFDSQDLVELPEPLALEKQQAPASTKCVAAILDGYPVLQHEALSGRVTALEVDVTAAQVPANARLHGTAMASLIVRGDLSDEAGPLASPLGVIPVLSAGLHNRETTPTGKLAIGVIHRALKALVQQRAQMDSPFSRVVVVNHSICDTHVPFVRAPSPWASLIDYYSHHHQLLFVVSAGNIDAPIPVADAATAQALEQMNPTNRDALVINSLRESSGTRGLLSPAETVNGLTVGALHADIGDDAGGTEIDPFQGLEMMGLGSALGMGVNRSVKPDLIANGGRTALKISTRAGQVQVHPAPSQRMGHKVARPGVAGESNRYGLSAGTSDAAALTTRSAVQIATELEEIFRQDGDSWAERPTRATILKALLVHSAQWGDVGKLFFDLIKDPSHHKRRLAEKNETTRYVGFGKTDPERVLGGTTNRITLLADDQIEPNGRHVFKLPVPTRMLRSRDVRTITFTLAWTTPIVVFSTDYRGVSLKLVDGNGKQIFWQGVSRADVDQPVQATMERGTVVHMQLQGHTLWRYGKGDSQTLEIGVQSMSKHPSTKNASVPYALAVTIEVAQSVDTKVYEQIRDDVRARQAQQQRTRTIVRS
ncbi:S8 family peptidase [Comamonas sp. Z1]|uniref:S8 family peptidase n=1 Tax=Comamonas sp. Z1 TaxID=2601246 RepID=UPI00165317D6|nr:S8 family peptidase [Comamonas sp. Z1]